MTFEMLDTAAVVTPAAIAAAVQAGAQAIALYGQPSAGWGEVHAASDAEFLAASQAPRGVVLIHFGPDAAQAIAQADRLRSIGVNVVGIAADKEWNDHASYVAFCTAVRATGRYVSIEYGTPAGDSADVGGAVSWWLAIPGWSGTPGPRYAVQNKQVAVAGVVYDSSVCADDFLSMPGPLPDPNPSQEYDVANLIRTSSSVTIGADGRGWYDLPAGVTGVVSVVVYTQDPATLGHYAAVPAFAGIAWPPGQPGQLVFGTGPDGQAPAGNYGFEYWSVA